MKSTKQAMAWWLLLGCLLILLMVVIGGITRLTGSGLSITEWNLIAGTLPPFNDQDWTIAFEKYRHSPQFLKVNSAFCLADFKTIFWWEYIHRLLGRLIGIIFLLPFLYFVFIRKVNAYLRNRLFLLLGLGMLQGFLGWFMVKSGLVDVPHVSPYRLAIHLFMAFLTFAYSFQLALGLLIIPKREEPHVFKVQKRLTGIILSILFLQIIYGAFMAGLHAGKVYNTFPKMGDQWIPENLFVSTLGWRNFFENIITVQFIHRALAWMLCVLIPVLWISLFTHKHLKAQQTKAMYILLAAFLLQFSLGIFTLLSAVELPIAVLHQAVAFILMGTLLHLRHRLNTSSLSHLYDAHHSLSFRTR
jgi:cytochrome c oxidase assembly protein subunit 15